MSKKKIDYIDFDVFVRNSGVKESTVKKNYKRIPGISKSGEEFYVISGTRYPYNIRNAKLNDYAGKLYVLLKAISEYKYISHQELRIESKQFEAMLRELLSAGLIQNNHLSNNYGANAYDCTLLGAEQIKRTDKALKNDIINMIASAAGTFTGAILSQVFDAA